MILITFLITADKNMHRVQEATEMFAKIQNAYQVLSDPQERAFYDRHRESILRKSKSTGGSKVAEGGYSVDDLMTFFDPSVFKGYGDDPKGFYSVYRDLFAFLEDLEAEECDNPAKYNYTSFGSKNSPFEPSLKLFYDKFLHFSSIRSFYEADNYDEGYAENRRHRRAIGKENQKFRDAMRREYTDTVRNLAAWVRKRDPRWQAYQKERTAQRLQAEARRKEENAKRRAEMAESYVAPEWVAVNDQCIDDEEFLLQQLERLRFEEFASSTAQDSETAEIDDNDIDSEGDGLDEFDDFYCVVCKKVFKNHKQWKNHEQSKKHKTNMLKAGFKPESESEFDEFDESEEDGNIDIEHVSDHESVCENGEDENLSTFESIDKDCSVSVDSSSDDETETAESILNFLKQDDSDNEIGKQKPPKKKNRQRKQPSEQQQPKAKTSTSAKSKKKETHNNQSTLKCSVCGESFDSRNKLFRHIDETGHAALKTKKK